MPRTDRLLSRAQADGLFNGPMGFPAATAAMLDERKVRRASWPPDDYGAMDDGWLMVFRDGVAHRWLVCELDMLATDWVCVTDN